MRKRIAALLLTLAMIATFMPAMALTSFAKIGDQEVGKDDGKVNIKVHFTCDFDKSQTAEIQQAKDAFKAIYGTTDVDGEWLKFKADKGTKLNKIVYNPGVVGYVVEAWATGHKDKKDAVVVTNDTLVDDIKGDLHVWWAAKTCTVSFKDYYTGELIEEQPVLANDKIDPIDDPARKNCEFLGWFDAEGNEWDFDNDTIEAEDVTLYARWTPVDNFMAEASSTTDNNIVVDWTPAPEAAYYVVKGAYCGKTMKVVCAKTTDLNFTVDGLKKGKKYKSVVYAYDAEDKLIGKSLVNHAIIGSVSGKYGNVTGAKTSIDSVVLKVKKTKKFTTSYSLAGGKKKVLYKRHCAKVRYATTDAKVATCKSGKITAKGAGVCYVYAIAPNGVYAKIKVEVTK